jgi:hypothetical protein
MESAYSPGVGVKGTCWAATENGTSKRKIAAAKKAVSMIVCFDEFKQSSNIDYGSSRLTIDRVAKSPSGTFHSTEREKRRFPFPRGDYC